MSIQSNFPAIAPTLNLSFALTKALDPRITFARASTATYYGTQTAKAEENLLLQSQTLDVSPWLTVAASVTANTSTAPDGTSTADKLIPDTASAAHYVRQVVTGTAQTYAYSVFAKADGYSWLQLWDAFDTGFANFDVTNGVTGQVSAGVTSSITSVGSGWYRCTIVKSLTAASQQMRIGVYDSDANRNASFTGDGTSGILLWGAQLEQRDAVTAYTPTTTQPITNYIPVLQTAASGVARFDHNPTTFESLGLLIEEQRTNLLTYSEQFDNAAWTKTNSTVTANVTVAPDGSVTADLLTGSGTGANYLFQGVTLVQGGIYTLTCYVKANVLTGSVRFRDFTEAGTADFNISTLVTPVRTGTFTEASITDVGNDWYRLSGTFAPTIATGNHNISIGFTSGSNTNSFFIWGAQLEAGAFPTSYIPTVASQVTRAADAASMTGTNFSSWYNQAAGTFYSEVIKLGNLSFQQICQVNDGSSSNAIAIGFGSGLHPLRLDVTTGGVSQASITGIANTTALNTSLRTAAAYAVNDFAISGNGAAVATDTLGTVPVVNQLGIGYRTFSTPLTLTGTIRKLSYYPIRCTDAQLQALTS